MTEERILVKVQKLLERANHPGTPEHERDSCLQMADAMMFKHAIDAAMLDAMKDPNERRKPINKKIHMYDPESSYRSLFLTMLGEMGRTNRVRVATYSSGDAMLVGFADDVEWMEMLWLHVFREFVTRIDPRWEPQQSFDFNVKMLKEAGWKWPNIYGEALKHVHPMPCDWPDGGYLIRAYRRQCKLEGVEANVRTQRHDAYKNTFAEAFTSRICMRLSEMRYAADETTSRTTGAEVALRDAFIDVNELFYQLFEYLRPMSKEQLQAAREELRRQQDLEAEKDAEFLASLTPKQRQREMEKRQEERRKRAAANNKYWEREDKRRSALYDGDGDRAGRRAADKVEMSRNAGVGDNRKRML